MNIFRIANASVLICIVGIPMAVAATTSDKARQYGLIGRFATGEGNCAKPASDTNVFYTYAISGPNVFVQREYANDLTDKNRVLRVDLIDGLIELEVHFTSTEPPETRVWAYSREGDNLHVKYNHDLNGNYSIKDFFFTATGEKTQLAIKCR